MGYNTWNAMGCEGINEAAVLRIVDAMKSLGLRELGYEYVNIDDCWAADRDRDGRLVPRHEAFPAGVKAVADRVHQEGFKFGLYSDRGTKTCAGYPGSAGYERVDAQTFAEWGVDYLKHDSCNAPKDRASAFAAYALMRDELNATGRPIHFSLCGWHPWYAPPDDSRDYLGGSSLGNSWRVSYDVVDWATFYHAVQINTRLARFAAPGGFNDPDMLIGSSPGAPFRLPPHQSRTQFSLLAVMASPLLLGSRLENLSAFDLATYSNRRLIRVNQDPAGRQGAAVINTCPLQDLDVLNDNTLAIFKRVAQGLAPDFSPPPCYQVWRKVLQGGQIAVAVVNFDMAPLTLDLNFGRDLGLPGGLAAGSDLWTGEEFPPRASFHVEVGGDGHSVVLLLEPLSDTAASEAGPGAQQPVVKQPPALSMALFAVLILTMAASAIWFSLQTPQRRYSKRNARV